MEAMDVVRQYCGHELSDTHRLVPHLWKIDGEDSSGW